MRLLLTRHLDRVFVKPHHSTTLKSANRSFQILVPISHKGQRDLSTRPKVLHHSENYCGRRNQQHQNYLTMTASGHSDEPSMSGDAVASSEPLATTENIRQVISQRHYCSHHQPLQEKHYTLVFLLRDNIKIANKESQSHFTNDLAIDSAGAVLLGMKKRGFGANKWNGFGGKVEAGETLVGAALRELEEECCVTAKELSPRGCLRFTFKSNPVMMVAHIFSTKRFEGEATETEEMRPKWTAVNEVPYDLMWADDKYWLPFLLQGFNVEGTFDFDDETVMLRFHLDIIDSKSTENRIVKSLSLENGGEVFSE